MSEAFVLERAELDRLFDALRARGYATLGPVVRDGAIVYDEIASAGELPAGWGADAQPGSYRLRRRDDPTLFGFAVGPWSPKRLLFPPRVRLFRTNADLEAEQEPLDETPCALIGLRACDLAAIAIQDRVLARDRDYAARRARLFVVAVDCAEPASTCFCASTASGPAPTEGFDLALTELAGPHRFVVVAGSERGADVLADLPVRPAGDEDLAAVDAFRHRARASMARELRVDGLREALFASLESPRWDEIAERCLTCGNCTLVCPTCFCTSVEDVNDLAAPEAERWRTWDTCFSVEYSYMHGGSGRPSARSRYRQWLVHKLATWQDQFGTPGCVGCGRCIAWCPVGIDITEEAAALRAAQEVSHAFD